MATWFQNQSQRGATTLKLAVFKHVAQREVPNYNCCSFPFILKLCLRLAPQHPVLFPIENSCQFPSLENDKDRNLRVRVPHKIESQGGKRSTDGKQPARHHFPLSTRGCWRSTYPPPFQHHSIPYSCCKGTYGHRLLVAFDGVTGGGGGFWLGVQGGELFLQLHDPCPFQRADRHGRQVRLPPRHLRGTVARGAGFCSKCEGVAGGGSNGANALNKNK